MRASHISWLCFTLCLLPLLPWCGSLAADSHEIEDAKEKAIIDRFVIVLEKNPRRGTALDKVYGYHVEHGTLGSLIESYRQRTKPEQGTETATLWMIVGLLESLRGQDAASVQAFGAAEQLAPANYLASFYLGQSLILVGQPDKAAEALERALERKPAQADLLDVYQTLGRVYQRAQKSQEALNVWQRLERQFPNDARVQEQIATTLLQENEYAAALPRYETLIRITKDRYRQSLFQMEAADIKVRLGKPDVAIKEFESLLAQLLPENWLYREVRRRIEGVYLRTDDQAGLIAYYEEWLKKSPKDLDAITRLSRLLAGYGRAADARKWLEAGLKLAPSNKGLRLTLINQLLLDHQYGLAAVQYEQLDLHEPHNPDTLREWGRTLLKDTSRTEVDRKQAAAAIWKRLLESRPTDPLIASQVGELFRQAEMTDEALELYRKAIALAPDQPQYREYLGEYLHGLRRKDEALETWRGIAQDNLKTAANLGRLAEVLKTFGYLPEAIEANTQACQLDPRDLALQLKQVDLLGQAERHTEALAQLQSFAKLPSSDEEREAWLSRELRELQLANQLQQRIQELTKEQTELDADRWYWLARAYELTRQLRDAAQAIAKASELAPQSIPALMAAARIQEAQNNWMAAVETYTRLSAVDRRYRTEYLKQIATLEQKLGRRARAIQAGRDLIAASPGNPESYEFFSQLCFQLGESEEGISALRRSVRVNPTEIKGMLSLAAALSEQFRTNEAIELYWRAFDKAPNLDDRLAIVQKVTELYLQINQFDRLLERLERQRREPNQQREMTICLAQAYQSAGDDGNARQELETLLGEQTRDTQLLMQLSKLCEADGDLDAAVKFQQQVVALAPVKESKMRLHQLLLKSGDTADATALMDSTIDHEKTPEESLKAIDALMSSRDFEQAAAALEKLRAANPNDWELLYREGVALSQLKEKTADAERRFQTLLSLKVGDDQKSVLGIVGPNQIASTPPLLSRTQSIFQLRRALDQLKSGVYESRVVSTSGRTVTLRTSTLQPALTPVDYGAARIAALGWLHRFARDNQRDGEFLDHYRLAALNSNEWSVQIDWYFLTLLADLGNETHRTALKLTLRDDADSATRAAYLLSLSRRSPPPIAPLDPDEIQHLLNCYRSLRESRALFALGGSFLQRVLTELKIAGNDAGARLLIDEILATTNDANELSSHLQGLVASNETETVLRVLDRLLELKPLPATETGRIPNGRVNNSTYFGAPLQQMQLLGQLMARRAEQRADADVKAIWERGARMAAARRELALSGSSRRGTRSSQSQGVSSLIISRGTRMMSESIDFPAGNDVVDMPCVQLLRQLFVIATESNTAQELVQYFHLKIAGGDLPPQELPVWKLSLAYLQWWLEEKDAAVETFAAAVQTLPDHPELKFELAWMYEKSLRATEALEIVDALPPTDQQAMQAREIMALRLSVNSGNVTRARTAAERLFGLRLDANLQVQLAQQMHQLGMHEQAEALLARAGRQAGNRADVLFALMNQYQSQGQLETATQIAYQLLRHTERQSSLTTTSGSGMRMNNPQETRQQVLALLKRSGKLPEMMKRVESQLQVSPNSVRLMQSMIEYATAAGDEKRVAELTARMGETKKGDPQFLLNLAVQLCNQGRYDDGLAQLKSAMSVDPRVLRNSNAQLISVLQRGGKLAEFGELLLAVDARAVSELTACYQNFLRVAANDEKLNQTTLAVLRKIWSEAPQARSNFSSAISGSSLFVLPEMYDLLAESFFSDATAAGPNAWLWTRQFSRISLDKGVFRLSTGLSQLLDCAAANSRWDDLSDQIAAKQAKDPSWPCASVVRAMVAVRRQGEQTSTEILEDLFTQLQSLTPIDRMTIFWIVGQELEPYESLRAMAIKYFEEACKSENIAGTSFQSSPQRVLARLYQRSHRNEEARRVLMNALGFSSTNRPPTNSSMTIDRIQSCLVLGDELRALGFPLDEIRLYQEQLARGEDFEAYARRFASITSGTAQAERIKVQIEAKLQQSMQGLQPQMFQELLETQFAGSDPAQPLSALAVANAESAPFNLLLLLETRNLEKSRLESVLSRMMSAAADNPTQAATIAAALARAVETRPQDLGLRILMVQLALKQDADAADAAVDRLIECIDHLRLEPTSTKSGLTLAQRREAMPQVALWLVARECLNHESLRSRGQQLAERAIQAARRQTDTGFALAILSEWSQIASQQRDPIAAERCLSEMLEIVIPPGNQPRPAAPQRSPRKSAGF